MSAASQALLALGAQIDLLSNWSDANDRTRQLPDGQQFLHAVQRADKTNRHLRQWRPTHLTVQLVLIQKAFGESTRSRGNVAVPAIHKAQTRQDYFHADA